MKRRKRGLTALSSDLHLKKGELLELLNLSRPHAHMIERGDRSMPLYATIVAGSLQLALGQSGGYDKTRVIAPTIDKKEIQNQVKELNLKILRLNRKIERWSSDEQQRLKALAAMKVWSIDATLPKSKRETLLAWKNLRLRELELSSTAIELAAAQARLAGLQAELAFWKGLA